MHPGYYNQPFHHYGRYRRGPSRIWWFFLGGAAFAMWQYSRKPEAERRRFDWFRECRERRLGGRDDAVDATRGRRGESSSMATQNSGIEAGFPTEDARNGDRLESEPLWKLRSEKEAERMRAVRDMEVREQLLNAREKVLSATESGLETLRQSLESLTRMVQEQRKDDKRDQSTSTDREKRD